MWLLVRADDGGNTYVIRDGLTEEEGRRLCAELTERGHKQSYAVYPYTPETRAEVVRRLGAFE